MPTLTYSLPGKQSPTTVEIFKQITTIGRGPDNDISLPDPLLAEDHAHIQFNGESFSLSTIHRKNNLLINGRSRRQVKLKHNDQVTMGTTDFKFRMLSISNNEKQEKSVTPLEAYERIHQFSRELLQGQSISQLLEKLVDQVIEVSNAERGFIILLSDNKPKVAVGRNLYKEDLADPIDLFSDSIVSQVIKEQKALVVYDALQDEAFKSSASVVHLQLSSVMCLPLRDRGKLLGVLYVGNSRINSLFDNQSLKLLTVFAAQASLLLQNALLVNDLELDKQQLADRLEELQYSGIIGSCDSLLSILNKVRKIATTDVSVLITGDTGTGKELIAHELHRRSNRSNGPFITINCGAIPENLLESELFGHTKGAFTGAVTNKIGKFKAADKGTLFLDEMGEMPFSLQVKLLRAIEDKKITPVGENRTHDVDIRIVAATNRNLETEVAEGRFRKDLYYRLNVIGLHLPPLRERGDDILLLSNFFLKKFGNEYGRNITGFTPQAIIAIRRYRWPGNIRELENRLRKAIILIEGTHIDTSDLEIFEETMEKILPLAEAKERFQNKYIRDILDFNNGNRTKTARDLGVDPRTIFRHLEKEAEKKK